MLSRPPKRARAILAICCLWDSHVTHSDGGNASLEVLSFHVTLSIEGNSSIEVSSSHVTHSDGGNSSVEVLSLQVTDSCQVNNNQGNICAKEPWNWIQRLNYIPFALVKQADFLSNWDLHTSLRQSCAWKWGACDSAGLQLPNTTCLPRMDILISNLLKDEMLECWRDWNHLSDHEVLKTFLSLNNTSALRMWSLGNSCLKVSEFRDYLRQQISFYLELNEASAPSPVSFVR